MSQNSDQELLIQHGMVEFDMPRDEAEAWEAELTDEDRAAHLVEARDGTYP